ncbi:MAG: ATP-binding cassette domain-containing protein, partial [Methanosarcina sp.]|nr:ATP-binding cassette domain-containing protein [Methanosarcina sp.]
MIEVNNLHKSFGSLKVLKGITEKVEESEVVCVIGPSGSGKSTFLRCLNLLETPTSGDIWIEGEKVTDPKVDINKIREEVGMVFQRFNLFPHMTALKNVAIAPMKVRGLPENEAYARAHDLLKKVGLEDKANVYPSSLSG